MSNNLTGNAWDKLDVKVITVVLLLAIFEFETFTFARGLVGIAAQDAIFSVILGGMLLILVTFLLVKLAVRFPQENLFQYSRRIWGKPIAFMIAAAYLLYFFTFLTLLFEDFSTANRILFLQETPELIPMVLMAVGAVWLVSYGFTAVIRFFQLVFPFFAILLVIILILGLREGQARKLTSIVQ